MRVMERVRVHRHIINRLDQRIQIFVVVFRTAAAPRGKIVRAGDPNVRRQGAVGLQALQMVHPTEDYTWSHKIRRRPVHHRFIANGDDLDNVWKLRCQCDSAFNFLCVRFRVLQTVIGCICPCACTINPRSEHHVHLEIVVLFLQFMNRLHHVSSMWELHVIRAQESDAHGVEDFHVFLQLIQCWLLRATKAAVTSVRNRGETGVPE